MGRGAGRRRDGGADLPIAHPRLGAEAPTTVEVLRSALGEVKAFGRPVQVDVLGDMPAPPGMTPLLSNDQLRRLGGLLIGVEVPAQFRELRTGVLLPLVFRRLQADLSRALRQAFFEFAEVDTSYRPGDVRALGPSTLTDAAREVDRLLVEVSCGFEFLPAITPVNSDQAWEAFRASGCEREPAFHYRPLPVDPDLLKRRLYDIRIEDVTDPALAAVFRAKRQELDRELTMLEDRDTSAFLPASVQLYGGVEEDLLSLADAVLARVAGDQPEGGRRALVTASTFAARARHELDAYRRDHPNLAAKVVLRDDLPGVMVVEGDVLVGDDLRIAAERVEALLQHEVGTHVVTHANGKAQPLQMLAVGLPGYEETQEGLAVLAEYLVGGLTASRMALLAARVVAVHHLLAGAGFVETFRALRQRQMAPRRAYHVAMRVYRSGGLTKDAMYLRGLADVLRHLGTGGALDPLFVGKLSLSAVPVIEELLWRQVLRPPLVRPRWLDHPSTAGRLEAARAGLTVLDVAAEVGA